LCPDYCLLIRFRTLFQGWIRERRSSQPKLCTMNLNGLISRFVHWSEALSAFKGSEWFYRGSEEGGANAARGLVTMVEPPTTIVSTLYREARQLSTMKCRR